MDFILPPRVRHAGLTLVTIAALHNVKTSLFGIATYHPTRPRENWQPIWRERGFVSDASGMTILPAIALFGGG